jgi:hypothetical protein
LETSTIVKRLLAIIKPYRSRAFLALFAMAGLLFAGALGATLYSRSRRMPELTGRWDLPTGSFWSVVQDGSRLTIEETHYLSREVWKRGTGTLDGEAVHVSLDWVFEGMPPQTGRFRLSADGRTLTGELRVPDRDPAQARFAPVVLMRR